MKLHYATTNPRKVASLQRDLAPYNIEVVQYNVELLEPRSGDVKEIAHAKLEQAIRAVKEPVVVLDAGFYIDAWNGFPRAYVHFALDTLGTRGIIKLMEGIPQRNSAFKECLAYLEPGQQPYFFQADMPGLVAPEERGSEHEFLWSRLGLIFIPEQSYKTLGEMTQEEYLRWRSIRRISAGKQFSEWLKEK